MRSDWKTQQRARDLRKRMTDAELILWSRIRPRAWPMFRFRRQHPIGSYIADFACPLSRVIVEIDGGHTALMLNVLMMEGVMRICEDVDGG